MSRLLLAEDGCLYQREKAVGEHPLACLSLALELVPEVTLFSFFKMLDRYPQFLALSELLPALRQMTGGQGEPSLKTDDIDKLVFYKTIAMKGGTAKTGLEIFTSLKGVKQNRKIQLKFFQLSSLTDHVLTLGPLEHVIFGDGQDLFQYDTVYTLFEFIEGICWELSFNFNPLQCTLRR